LPTTSQLYVHELVCVLRQVENYRARLLRAAVWRRLRCGLKVAL
jgi:hypothetical protein